MKVLAIDTGGECCAVSLHINGLLVAEQIVATGRDQAKILAPLTAEVLNQHALQVRDIDRFGIATGPGSFTGLRVGLAFVRGLALASGKLAYGFDHFTILAHALKGNPHPILIIRESKRDDLFCAWLGSDGRLSEYFLSPAKQIIETLPRDKPFAITGNGIASLLQHDATLQKHIMDVPNTDMMQALAILTGAAPHSTTPPQPVYLRDADVNVAKQVA